MFLPPYTLFKDIYIVEDKLIEKKWNMQIVWTSFII